MIMADNVNTAAGSSSGKRKKTSSTTHKVEKRAPLKPEEGKHVVYVHTKANLRQFVTRCTKLIHDGVDEIVIYCLGAAIRRGILLALQVAEEHPLYHSSVNTFTSILTDDLEPSTDDADYDVQNRFNSGVRIVLKRENI